MFASVKRVLTVIKPVWKQYFLLFFDAAQNALKYATKAIFSHFARDHGVFAVMGQQKESMGMLQFEQTFCYNTLIHGRKENKYARNAHFDALCRCEWCLLSAPPPQVLAHATHATTRRCSRRSVFVLPKSEGVDMIYRKAGTMKTN